MVKLESEAVRTLVGSYGFAERTTNGAHAFTSY
jgi:hypothetical protein